jgi:Sel1 repeat
MIIRWLILLALVLPPLADATPGDAAYRLGHPQQAAELYRQGALNGDALAATKLGLLIDDGAVSSATFGVAGTWFTRACDLGDKAGCHNAGIGFEYGKSGLERNYDNARTYYEKGAALGYIQSEYNLGSLYANQYFNDDAKGLIWLLRAQQGARKCASLPICGWILKDPPGHIEKLKSRLTSEQVSAIESQLAAQ